MDRDKEKRLLAAGNFVENNGRVLRTVNILRDKYNKLRTLSYALTDISEGEIRDCINYLQEAGYIHLRDITTKASGTLADNDYDELEAKLTATGIRLLAGKHDDPCIRI